MKKKSKLTKSLLFLLTFTILISGCITAFAASGKWIRSGERWWFRHADSSYTANGWEYINGKWYHFDSDGWMQTGWQRIGGKWYYLTSDGDMVTGWKKINGKWYHMDTSGAMDTDWKYVYNGWYYFGSDGERRVGWQNVRDKWYHLNGNNGIMDTNWKYVYNGWYYFGEDGERRTGMQDINGERYYLNRSNGIMQTGFVEYGRPGDYYYFNADGAMVYGWQEIDSETYYFDNDSGLMYYDEMVEIDGFKYYFNNKGIMQTGFAEHIGAPGDCYYFNADGAMVYGLQEIDGETYYFDNDSGLMYYDEIIEFDGLEYYFGNEGKMMHDYFLRDYDYDYELEREIIYYFDENGIMYSGWKYVDDYDVWVYFGEDGIMQFSKWIDGYYVNNSGVRTDNTEYTFEKEIAGIDFYYGNSFHWSAEYIYSENAEIISRFIDCVSASTVSERYFPTDYIDGTEYFYYIKVYFEDGDYDFFSIKEEKGAFLSWEENGSETYFDIDVQPLADIWKVLNA